MSPATLGKGEGDAREKRKVNIEHENKSITDDVKNHRVPSLQFWKRILWHKRATRRPRPTPTLRGGESRTNPAETISNQAQEKQIYQEYTKPKTHAPKTRKTPKVEKPLRLPMYRKTSRKRRISNAAEMRRLAIHGYASRLIYATLDSPCKRTMQVNLQTPRTSYSFRRSRGPRLRN